MPRPMNSPSIDCPLDLSGWKPEDIIRRWREAFRYANAWDTAQQATYDRGWFVVRDAIGSGYDRLRRKQVAEMIWRLENRAKANG